MPRTYKRKTQRQSVSSATLQSLANDVKTNKLSLREAAEKYGLTKSTVHRHLKNLHAPTSPDTQAKQTEVGYTHLANTKQILSPKKELELANHLKALDNRFYGLSPVQCRELGYQFAKQNQCKVPSSWKENEIAG